MCRRFRYIDFFINNRKYLVDRSNNPIYYCFGEWFLYRDGLKRFLFFYVCRNSSNRESGPCNADHYSGRPNNILRGWFGYIDFFFYNR